LAKNAAGIAACRERRQLEMRGGEARLLTLKKAHAYLLLKRRDQAIPSAGELQDSESHRSCQVDPLRLEWEAGCFGRKNWSVGAGISGMSLSLIDALRQVDLQPGRVYTCQVGRLRVELRVDEAGPQLVPSPWEASDVMIDPWSDLPAPQSGAILQATPAPPLAPDIPDLPSGS
jgi:hypothetical protein